MTLRDVFDIVHHSFRPTEKNTKRERQMNFKTWILTTVVLTAATTASATSLPIVQRFSESLNKYDQELASEWTISEVTVEEVETEVINGEYFPNYVAAKEEKSAESLDKMDLGQIIIATDQLIALGKKIWTIVEAGKPVVNTNMAQPISVLPKIEGDNIAFYNMEGWSTPKVKSYRVSYKNGFGSEVIAFTYTVYFQHGGSYEGKGQYLTSVNVEASEVYVSWGFKFDATSSLIGIANQGSVNNPVASATISVAYKATSWFSDVSTGESFFVNGRGELVKLR